MSFGDGSWKDQSLSPNLREVQSAPTSGATGLNTLTQKPAAQITRN